MNIAQWSGEVERITHFNYSVVGFFGIVDVGIRLNLANGE